LKGEERGKMREARSGFWCSQLAGISRAQLEETRIGKRNLDIVVANGRDQSRNWWMP